ncbi:MAG: aspartyl protease family protein [Hyphomicrobiales bacterium]|jgi:aspartyl protease family protein|nr:aspartyl protease family protein [Hyphomicrobiales bacterium]
MRQILFFAIAALVLAGVMPRLMTNVGDAPVAEAKAIRKAEPAPKQSSSYRTVTVQGDRLGHFQVEGSVDGRRLDFMVDTGASLVALRERDANRLGIFPAPRDYTARTSTANGVIAVAPVRLSSLEINGIRIYDVGAVVIPDKALGVNLLGMSFLSRVRRFEMANGRLVMEQ